MQRRKASKRLLIAAVMRLLPLRVAAEVEDDLLEEPIEEYDAEALFDDGPGEPGWVPSFRADIGVNHQATWGQLSTPQLRASEPDGLNSFVGVRNVFKIDENPIDGPALGFGFEIMAPEIEAIPGKPRPLFLFQYRDQLEGYSTVVRDQVRPPPTSNKNAFVRLKGNHRVENWIAFGLGAAFQLPIEGYNLKLKPSINYVKMDAVVANFLFQPVVALDPNEANNDFPRVSELPVTTHAIAPRLELDAEVYREGPLSVGFFLGLEFHFTVSGPTKHQIDVASCFSNGQFRPPGTMTTLPCANIEPGSPFFGVNVVGGTPPGWNGTDPIYPDGLSRFDLKRETLAYHANAGLRFSWMGGP